MANPDLFDAYFRRADTDRDGRVSGQEAVAFFQGANLNREVLAKIWQYADEGQTGFLSRAEFYNALKLVTVAQTGRELTPAIVNRALHGPAASQIPPPQIQLVTGPQQPVGVVRPNVRPPAFQQYAAAGAPQQFTPRPSPTSVGPTVTSSPAADWPTSKSSSWPGPGGNNIAGQNKATIPGPSSQVAPDPFGTSAFHAGGNSTTLKVPSSTTNSAEPDLFGGDVFTAVPSKKQTPPLQPQQSFLASPQPQQQSAVTQSQVMAQQHRGLQTSSQPSAALVPSSAVPAAIAKQIQPVPMPSGTARPETQAHGFVGATAPGIDPAKNWPRMSDSVVRRYTKIFFEVDTDKDGKISGIQARDLFLSWNLPREVLKQVWDLADQDHDSMLSLREFCVALYLMERFREGRTLSAAIPSASYFDDSGVQALRIAEAQVAVSQNSAGYNLPAWQSNPSVLQPTAPAVPGLPPGRFPRDIALPQGQGLARPPVHTGGGSIESAQLMTTPGSTSAQPVQLKSRAPGLEMNLVNQLNADDQLTLQAKHQDAVDAEKKVQELEKQIMDSKEKIEYYRTKLQDIVLFKTRCDNRLAEITERAASDKREAESLAKRYDEKFKQAGESQSRLLADEAAFRDVQERRLELYNAILRMEQGGDTNALLQSRADRLHNDLDELRKALNAKCKHFKLRIKPTSILELPFGWQPGMQENAAQWDDHWDEFEDEGFVYIQEFMEEGTAGSDAVKPKSAASWEGNEATEEGFEVLSADGEVLSEETVPNESASRPVFNDDGTTSNGDTSPRHDTSPPSSVHSGSSTSMFNNSKVDSLELQSDEHRPSPSGLGDSLADNGGDWASVFSHRGDDMDSPSSWATMGDSKASAESSFQEQKSTNASFGFSDPFVTLSNSSHLKDGREDFPSFGPIHTKQTSVFFDNSVPSTPARNSTASPFDSYGGGRDAFERYSSFSSSVGDFGHPSSDSFLKFDSFNSVRDSGPVVSRGFTSFDDSDPFSGTGPFGGGQTPKRTTDSWSAFS